MFRIQYHYIRILNLVIFVSLMYIWNLKNVIIWLNQKTMLQFKKMYTKLLIGTQCTRIEVSDEKSYERKKK
jgi:hypothetical protein